MPTLKATSGQTDKLLQLKIQLSHTRPAIWRRVVVPDTITLAALHKVIQTAMGWTDSHLHEFEIGGIRYGMPDPDSPFGDEVVPEERARLGKCLGSLKSLRYTYDFGDDWLHSIKVEKSLPSDDLPVPRCTGGANACPPEDVGGPFGYEQFREALADPSHPEHEDMLEWYGDGFDATELDLDEINRRLGGMRV